MSIVDHEQNVVINFNINKAYNALLNAIPGIDGMKLDSANDITHTIQLKAGVSLFSWGENITVTFEELSEDKTKISVLSTPKTGVLFGGTMDMGKNRKNINRLLDELSKFLK